jgi:hypothetical protein
MADISGIALRFLYVAIGATVAGYLQQACWSYTSVRQANRMRRMFLEAVLRQEIAFFDTEATTGGACGMYLLRLCMGRIHWHGLHLVQRLQWVRHAVCTCIPCAQVLSAVVACIPQTPAEPLPNAPAHSCTPLLTTPSTHTCMHTKQCSIESRIPSADKTLLAVRITDYQSMPACPCPPPQAACCKA